MAVVMEVYCSDIYVIKFGSGSMLHWQPAAATPLDPLVVGSVDARTMLPLGFPSHWLPTAGVLELRHPAQQEILLICIFAPNTSHRPDWDFPELCLSLRLCLPRPFFRISVIGKRTASRTESLPITSAPSLLVLISIFLCKYLVCPIVSWHLLHRGHKLSHLCYSVLEFRILPMTS